MNVYQGINIQLNEGYTIIRNESETVTLVVVCEHGTDLYVPPMTIHRIDQKIIGITLSHRIVVEQLRHDQEEEDQSEYDDS